MHSQVSKLSLLVVIFILQLHCIALTKKIGFPDARASASRVHISDKPRGRGARNKDNKSAVLVTEQRAGTASASTTSSYV